MRIGNNKYGGDTEVIDNNKPATSARALNLAKVFGYLFIALALTGGLTYLFSYLFSNWIISSGEKYPAGLTAILIISAIALIVLTIVIQFVLLKGKHSLLPVSIIYLVVMSILLASFCMFLPYQLIGMAFGITCVIFGLLCLIGLLSKGSMKGLTMVIIGLFMGAGITALMSLLFVFLLPGIAASMIWIVDFVIFGAVMLATIVDMYNINKICEQGEMSNNITLYCAFTLYVDFIYIFIRICYYLILIFGRR